MDAEKQTKVRKHRIGGAIPSSERAVKTVLATTGPGYGFYDYHTKNGAVILVDVTDPKAKSRGENTLPLKMYDEKGNVIVMEDLTGTSWKSKTGGPRSDYTEEVFFKFADPEKMDIHKSKQAIPIQNRKDPGCPCCFCCNPCPCIDSWNRCGEGKGMTFGGKQLSSETYAHPILHVGHNGSHKIRSNHLYWAVFDIFNSQGEEGEVSQEIKDKEDAGQVVSAKERAKSRLMQYNDVILYICLGDHTEMQKRSANDDGEGSWVDPSELVIDISESIRKIAAKKKKKKKKASELEKVSELELTQMEFTQKELIAAYREKWGVNEFARFEMDGKFFSLSQGSQTMRHDDMPLYFCWDKVLSVIEYAGGEVSFAHFLAILGLEQRSECGKILCCCCDKDQECCDGETCANVITCGICGDSRMWSKPAFKDDKGNVVKQSYCAERGGPCGPCYEACGCQSCCNV